MPPRLRALLGLTFAAAIAGASGDRTAAESALLLPEPEVMGEIAAQTYDEQGLHVGTAELRVQRLANGNYELSSESGIDGSARAAQRAELEPIGGGRLRPVLQVTESRDEQGRSLGRTTIDHRRGVATCGVPEGSDAEPVGLVLPEGDRVANVPLNLLFQPLVSGEQEHVDFQVLLCRVRARLVNARAEVVPRQDPASSRLIEVRYELDFGPLLSRVAAPFLPRLSVWFDESTPGTWVGHRMPLFSKGPTVLVVRQGFAPRVLGTGH
jgi:hypothetical protein